MVSESDGDQERIVVGGDGSESSNQALRWAARQAGFTGATLEAVTSWEYPAFYGWSPAMPDDVDYEDLARQGLIQTIEGVFGEDRPTRVETRVVPKHPGQRLVELAEG